MQHRSGAVNPRNPCAGAPARACRVSASGSGRLVSATSVSSIWTGAGAGAGAGHMSRVLCTRCRRLCPAPHHREGPCMPACPQRCSAPGGHTAQHPHTGLRWPAPPAGRAPPRPWTAPAPRCPCARLRAQRRGGDMLRVSRVHGGCSRPWAALRRRPCCGHAPAPLTHAPGKVAAPSLKELGHHRVASQLGKQRLHAGDQSLAKAILRQRGGRGGGAIEGGVGTASGNTRRRRCPPSCGCRRFDAAGSTRWRTSSSSASSYCRSCCL